MTTDYIPSSNSKFNTIQNRSSLRTFSVTFLSAIQVDITLISAFVRYGVRYTPHCYLVITDRHLLTDFLLHC
ncbi:hypothetical protein QQG55_47650 [Brugia pahangi]